jgi:RNA polymerase sigma-70 factor, ECF subfamily
VTTATQRRRRNPATNEDDLVARARGADAAAFATLYTTHSPAVTRLVASRVGPDFVNEIVADVFVRAWKSLPKYRSKGKPFIAWLFGIARFAVADHYRVATRHHSAELEPDMDSTATDDVTSLMARLHLRDVLGKLPKRQQRVIELKYFGALTNEEVAEALGMSTGAVNATQWRGLQRMRSLLEEDQ